MQEETTRMVITVGETGLKFGQDKELILTADVDIEKQLIDFLTANNLTPGLASIVLDGGERNRLLIVKEILEEKGWQFGEARSIPKTVTVSSSKDEQLPKWMIFLTLGLVIASVVMVVVIFSKNSPQGLSLSPKPSPIPTVMPTSTPALLNKDTVKIRVLNGSGKAGMASKLGDSLGKLGFAIAGVGNADADTYDTTLIRHTSLVAPEVIMDLKEALVDYSPEVEALAEPDGDAQIVVIIGSN